MLISKGVLTMTKEKMIEVLYKTLVDITSEEDAKKIIETVRNNHGKFYYPLPEYNISSVIYELENEIAAADAKKSGNSKRLKAVKELLKESFKDHLKKAYSVNDYQCVCNGYMFFALKDQVKINTESEESAKEEKLYALFNDLMEKSKVYSESITIPDIKELEKELSEIKTMLPAKQKKDIIILINNEYSFNANRFITCLNAVNTSEINVNGSKKPISMNDKSGNIAVLMPIGSNVHETMEEFKKRNHGKIIIVQDGKIVK